MTLSKKQKQHLKGLAHSLKPIVQLGNNGLTEGVMAEIDLALSHHELIKVKVPTDERELKKQIFAAIVRESNSVEVQVIGHIIVLYRQSDEPKIELPRI
ncbi:ribosome assembly RNA-binding protein YhbY [Catenovulum maritimum]|uniref:RNA-binding protein YhbY n=1 Tax=Catenovulum maritimum TaxID=1513271 RepID=A0A0J8GMM7_9ALTE|nr:ribosome assembly RNA-binding protein YhbY [Catenovulum maritimum]KMT64045.1 RNA-binding protein YhbY [Catenovulum maritimum]